ncbi:MAG: ATP-binding protein [Clostridia bacterium]
MQSITGIMSETLGIIGEEARNGSVREYVGEDGLRHCVVCCERTQFRITGDSPFSGQVVSVACKCRRDAYADEEQRRKIAEEMRRLEELKSASLMDERMRQSTFKSFQPNEHNQRALRVCRNYAEAWPEMLRENQSLLMVGAPGTGKTFAAACIANALLARRVPLIMTSFVKLMNYKYADDWQEMIARLNAAHLLIIDDLGAERSTDYGAERVYDMIDSRYRAKRPMIVTSNLSIKQMLAETDIRRYRVFERIVESSYPLEFTGTSWRIKEAGERFERMKARIDPD